MGSSATLEIAKWWTVYEALPGKEYQRLLTQVEGTLAEVQEAFDNFYFTVESENERDGILIAIEKEKA